MASVFLSYARDDRSKAEALATALEELGHSVWWDRSIEGGSRFSQEIEQALKRSDAVVVMWSHVSVQSAWVTDEAAEGRDTGRLVPVVIDDVKPPLGFRQYQAIDLSAWRGRGKNGLIDPVHRAIIAKTGSVPATKVPARPRRAGFGYRRLGLAAATLLVLVVGALSYWLAAPRAGGKASALRLHVGEMKALAPDVPASVPESLREELLSALGTDAVIVASTDKPSSATDAGYALTASVRKARDMLRFTVHVVNDRSGATVWTETLERPATLMELAPRQVAVSVSQVLRCGLGGAARYRKPMPDETLSIYFNFCEEYWADTMGRAMNYTRALDIARRVAAAAPDFSRGWSGLGQVANWASRGNGLVDAETLRAEARRAAERALKLDAENSQAYEVLASLEPPFAFAAREKLHVKSVSVRPGDCGCEYVGYGSFLSRVGRNAEAVDAFKRAHDMIPLSADVNAGWAEALFVAGRAEEARQAVQNLLELWPDNANLREILVRSALWTGRHDEALQTLNDPRMPVSEPERAALRSAFEALKSRTAAARASAARQLQVLSSDSSTNGSLLVAALGALGANEAALSIAAARIQRDGPRALDVLFEPAMASARRTPQFAQLAQRFGLVDYWRGSKRKPDFCKETAPAALCSTL